MTAAHTSLPVLGVPVQSALSGQDSLLSIVQMPAGIPVGALAIGAPGAENAALLAAILYPANDAALADRLDAWRAQQSASVEETRVTSDARPSLPEAAILPPGSVIGIVGGQLGRMLALAAANLGLKTIFSPPNMTRQPCKSAMPRHWAIMRNSAKLAAFADKVDVVTYEFENIPANSVTLLANAKPVAPPPAALAVSQDRLDEKRFLDGLGCAVAPFHPIDSLADLRAASAIKAGMAFLKTRRFGYDGKGQWRITGDRAGGHF